MRSLVEDTNKLTLNSTNNNNNSSSTSSSSKITKTNTTSSSSTQLRGSNKNYKMQQQSVTNATAAATAAGGNKQKKQTLAQQTNNNPSHGSTTISLPKASHANTTEEIAGGVQDTIYLCNFRVSVDGEWLCLKELQDLDVSQHNAGSSSAATSGGGPYHSTQRYALQKNKKFASLAADGDDNNGILAIQNLIGRRLMNDGQETASGTKNQHMLTRHAHDEHGLVAPFGLGLGGGGGGEWANASREPAEIERSNLVNICKLVVKELLEQSLRYGRMLDSDHLPLQHFFIVIEHVLGHGLRPKKGLLGPRKELWDLLQSVENYCPEAQDITASVRDLPTVRTHIGRARAWLRIALMQKKLADYLQALIEHREDALYEYYEPHALMMSDEIVVIMGILVGLNVIDCNLCVKEEDLDSQQGVIDFSLYLRSSSRSTEAIDADADNQAIDANGQQGNMIAVLDQKNYIEELNRHLNATVANLQAKVESLTTTNALMKEDLAIARNSLLALQAENQAMRQQPNSLANAASMQSMHSDNSSNSSSEKATIESLTAELAEEKKRSAELDKELKLQVSLKAESDMAMKLLEKDIHEKQDTIVSLRRQLDDIKQINLDMYRKLQECEASLKHKNDLLTKLETQKEDMSNTIAQLEKKWCNDKSNLGEILKNTSQTLSTQVTASEERAARAEAECRIEREWRVSLQEKEVKLKEKITSLQNCVKELTDDMKNNAKVRGELEKMRTQWSEAQTTLEELGIQLSVSKLKVSELEERERRHQQLMSSTSSLQSPTEAGSAGIWAPDSIATHCTACNKEFNLTRRKHHCRSCGEIFCKSCSEQTLALVNESGQLGKPVRVCDSCYSAKK